MKLQSFLPFILSGAVLAVGCGNSGGGGGGDDAVDAAIDAPDIPAGYTRLIGRTWTLAAGQRDTYKCVRLTMDHDVYITGFKSQAPNGSHHAVLSIANTNNTRGADGEYDCTVGTLGLQMLYASGVGSDTYDFPAGVGIKVSAGQQIHLNLHLYNASDSELSGDSAVLVKTVPAEPPMLAEFVFAGKFAFSIPGNNQPYSTTGGCTVPSGRDFQLFAVWPHMHQLANHQKVEFVHGGQTTVLHDAAFAFGEQKFYEQSPMVHVVSGDQIRVTCTWTNPGPGSIGFGDSSDKEMCFAGLYRYPAASASLFECTDFPGGIPGGL